MELRQGEVDLATGDFSDAIVIRRFQESLARGQCLIVARWWSQGAPVRLAEGCATAVILRSLGVPVCEKVRNGGEKLGWCKWLSQHDAVWNTFGGPICRHCRRSYR